MSVNLKNTNKKGNKGETCLLYYAPEGRDFEWLNDLKVEAYTGTDSMAVYRVAPVLVHSKDEFVFPKIKIVSKDNLKVSTGIEENCVGDFRNKFEAKENVFGADVDLKENAESNFLDVVEEASLPEDMQVKKPEDEDDGRKHFDKFNLLRAFKFAFDNFERKSELDFEEDYTHSELRFDSVESRLQSMFTD